MSIAKSAEGMEGAMGVFSSFSDIQIHGGTSVAIQKAVSKLSDYVSNAAEFINMKATEVVTNTPPLATAVVSEGTNIFRG